MKTIGIMGAMPEEVDQVVMALQDIDTEEYAGVTYTIGYRGGKKLIVCCAGMGKVNAGSTAQVLISHFKVDGIFFTGVAGNMSCEVGIGDVVIGKELTYHDADHRMLAQSAPGTATYTAHPLFIDAAEQGCRLTGTKYLVGRIATGDQFVGDSETKRRIQQQYHPDCVEMEGAAVAHVCMRNNTPFVVLRAMCDDCEDSIESLGAEEFDVSEYVTTSSAIVIAAIEALETLEG